MHASRRYFSWRRSSISAIIPVTTNQPLDGSVHNHPAIAENDIHRDARLADLGFTVIRFENKDVFNQTDWVLDEIRKRFKFTPATRTPPHDCLPPSSTERQSPPPDSGGESKKTFKTHLS